MTPPPATVAVVDDDPRILQLLELELLDAGFQARCFNDPLLFLEGVNAAPPELVLLDLLMPEIDGIECLKRLRQVGFEGPVVIFTALSDNQKRLEAEQDGADAYVLKPDLFENLARIVEQHLRGAPGLEV